MSEKVYCGKCKYNGIYNPGPDSLTCECPNNIMLTLIENYFEKTEYQSHMNLASEINKNNDCSWFKKKEVPF